MAMTRCFAKGCKARIRSDRFGCLRHWRKLPKAFRDEVWAAFRAKNRIRTLELVATAYRMSMDWDGD